MNENEYTIPEELSVEEIWRSHLLNLKDREVQIKLEEYRIWIEHYAKMLELLLKYFFIYLTMSGVILIYNLENGFERPISYSLLFHSILSTGMIMYMLYPTRYLKQSDNELVKLTWELNAKLGPPFDLLRIQLLITIAIVFALGVSSLALFISPERILGAKSLWEIRDYLAFFLVGLVLIIAYSNWNLLKELFPLLQNKCSFWRKS